MQIINSTPRRSLAFIQESSPKPSRALAGSALIDCDQLPAPILGETLRWFHCELLICGAGGYLSILKHRRFSRPIRRHALIARTIGSRPDFDAALEGAMQYARSWNILRVTGLSRGHPAPLVRLCGDYSLCVSLGRLKGAGAYVIDRAAAAAFRDQLLPMRLPFDHAFD